MRDRCAIIDVSEQRRALKYSATIKTGVLSAILGRYLRAGREYKRKILDDFCEICEYHRKHAIRLLSRHPHRAKRKPGRSGTYGEAERTVLERIWLAANRPCSKRLKAAVAISARSLDRLMPPVRRRHGTRGRCGTRPGSLLKNLIPIKIRLELDADRHFQRLDGPSGRLE